jgi:DNA-binding transcriptional ArsR family regulator
VVRFVFTVEDLARTRFAVSPIWELVRSLVALRDPSLAAIHLPWLRTLSGRLGGVDIERAAVLAAPTGYSPDFLTPPPAGPLGTIADDFAALRRTPVAQLREEMELFASQHPRAEDVVAAWLARPRHEVRRLADVLEAYWDRALAPEWSRVRAFLDADITYRAQRLAAGGQAALFADLASGVRWHEGNLDVTVPRHDATIELGGRGLVLMPSAFAAMRPGVIDRPPSRPTLIYPARGIATLWETPPPAPDGLARLLGTTRAAALGTLDAPRSTAELSRRLAISPATASHHLAALRDAGLVTGRRDGRFVLYVRTPVGDALARGPGDAGA